MAGGSVRTICIFCGSKNGDDPSYSAGVRSFGEMLAAAGITMVYGGGDIGLMGEAADSVIGAGGEVIGIIPKFMLETEVGHRGITRLEVVRSMHERKARMAELSDAFVAFPGGIGTLEELFETWTWAQLGLHDKPMVLVNTNGYFDSMLEFISHMVDEGFLRERVKGLLAVASGPESVLETIDAIATHGARTRPGGAADDGVAVT